MKILGIDCREYSEYGFEESLWIVIKGCDLGEDLDWWIDWWCSYCEDSKIGCIARICRIDSD